jgi:hypothetical protein
MARQERPALSPAKSWLEARTVGWQPIGERAAFRRELRLPARRATCQTLLRAPSATPRNYARSASRGGPSTRRMLVRKTRHEASFDRSGASAPRHEFADKMIDGRVAGHRTRAKARGGVNRFTVPAMRLCGAPAKLYCSPQSNGSIDVKSMLYRRFCLRNSVLVPLIESAHTTPKYPDWIHSARCSE